MTLPVCKIAEIIGAQVPTSDQTPISYLLTDSRDLAFAEHTLFFALRTSGNDGHNFIDELRAKGVSHFVVDEPNMGSGAMLVPSVLDALQQIGVWARGQMSPSVPVVGITGSRGKTIVKELLYKILRSKFVIVRSPRSYNSQIGVPLSLWEVTPQTNLAIFEAGISEPGEMDRLQRIIRPTIGVFTSITDEHQEGFESIEAKAHEKARLFKDCPIVFIPSGNNVIYDAVKAEAPQAEIRLVDGGNLQIARVVASYLLGYEADVPAGLTEKISPRIDVSETLKNCQIIYDGYTNDQRSILDAVNFQAKRVAVGRKSTVVLGWPDAGLDVDALQRLLVAKGVQRLIAIGFPQTLDFGIAVEQVGSVDEFADRYTISDFNDELILVKGDADKGFENIKTLLEAPRHETIMEVDLGAITRNFNYYRSLVKPGTGLVAMVKAAGYGVGSLELAKTLQSQGAAYLAVAVIDEGAELRRAGIKMPIMVMNPISTNYKALFDNKLEPSVFSLRELNLLLDNARRLDVKDYPVHIKLDTGMHRLGFLEDELPDLVEVLKGQNCVKVASIFSHLATADCLDQDEYTIGQLQAYDRMSGFIKHSLPYPVKRHVLNTAGIMRYPQYQYDMVRLGIGLYGVSPIPMEKTELSVVARLFTTIISIKHWMPGITIGYGRKGKVEKPSVIATIPIGYADGLDRHLSNGAARFLVNGVECPVIGNICMDQCMIDVTNANAKIGDKVEIFGTNMPVERLSDTLQTIPYEILTSISPRVKRIYFRE